MAPVGYTPPPREGWAVRREGWAVRREGWAAAGQVRAKRQSKRKWRNW